MRSGPDSWRRLVWRLGAVFALPVRDVLRGQGRCLARASDLAWMAAGLLTGWWLYVPAHELLHAAGCAAAGGAVTRLEIQEIYGGAILARLIPWVVAGGDYAGRLSGFETRGRDAVYLTTDLAPFVLTVFPGVWALRRAARRARPAAFGAALPLALAPFLSLTGDAYEIGSILVTRLPPWLGDAGRLRGDDLFAVAARLHDVGGMAWAGLVGAALTGVVWAVAVYGLGHLAANRLGEPACAVRVAASADEERS